MDALSISGLNPAAPPFTPVALVPAKAQYISPPPVALPPAGFVPPQCIYPPPPACWGLVACGFRCGAGFASKCCTCAPFVREGVPALPHPAWVHPRPPLPVATATVYYCTPPTPRPASRCYLNELGNDSDYEAANEEAGNEPSARSVKLTLRRTALLPPRPPTRLPPPAFGCKPRRGRRVRLAFDPSSDTTALMIRNIPNKFMKGRLMAILDQHCAEQNAKLPPGGCGAVKSEYDFLYVPVDFRTQCNKGYAFVNMTTATAAQRLHAFLQGHRWEAASSRKVCDVVQARIGGGLDAFVGHFSGSQFHCDKEAFLPVRFEPPRDGVQKTAEHVIGRLARASR